MPAPSDACYPWLTEFLCDYVDETMEPQARAMFEECLSANPELREHVATLTQARTALGRYGKDVAAPTDLHRALHQRLRSDCRCAQAYALCCQEGAADAPTSSLGTVGVSALVAILMVSAMLVVSSTFDPAKPAQAVPTMVDRAPVGHRAVAPAHAALVSAAGLPLDSVQVPRAFSR
jgi:anti-sigma factor RsiW